MLTGLKQKYDVDLRCSADRELAAGHFAQNAAMNPSADLTDDIFSKIRKSLGLRLQPHKKQVEFVVIDHLDRVPSAN
jgi:uncharacterized protein (TIGR03435 family)